jgi:hypothetical protein
MHAIILSLAVAWHYFCGHIAGFLAASLIPTVLAGLVNKPGADSGKVAILLKALLRFCGWAQHYDEPGSVKIPMQELVIPLLKFLARKAGLAAILVVCASASISGCAALKGQTLQNDVKILTADAKQIVSDCKTKCGPEVAALGPLVLQALTVATSNANALGLIMAGVAMLPAAVQAGEGIWCVIETVRADLKAMNTPQAAQAATVAEDLIAQHRFEIMRAEATRSAL